ncbi:MAG: hypothetical protein H7242_00415 [Microbacteriaceae bacterium]|nr:hypothetical protein [Burkholderiaceae bacterium]
MRFVHHGTGTPGTGLPTGRFDHFDPPALPPNHGGNTDSLDTSGQLLLTAADVPELTAPARWRVGLEAGCGLLARRRTAVLASPDPAIRTRSG